MSMEFILMSIISILVLLYKMVDLHGVNVKEVNSDVLVYVEPMLMSIMMDMTAEQILKVKPFYC